MGVPSFAEASVTVQCEWTVMAGRTNPGVPPEAHSGAAPSAEMQIFVVSVGEVVTISTDTTPGPSLTNVKVRAMAPMSVVESSMTLVNVSAAVGDAWDGSGTAVGPAVGVGGGLGVGGPVGAGVTEGEPDAGVAVGPGEVAAAIGLADAASVGGTGPGPAA